MLGTPEAAVVPWADQVIVGPDRLASPAGQRLAVKNEGAYSEGPTIWEGHFFRGGGGAAPLVWCRAARPDLAARHHPERHLQSAEPEFFSTEFRLANDNDIGVVARGRHFRLAILAES
jgi:hypothetical protein